LFFRTSLRSASEENYGRLSSFAKREKSPEIRIGCYYDPLLAPGAIDQPVVGGLHFVIAHMRSVVSRVSQSSGNLGRKRIIDEKSQEAERSGSSRSRTASAA
jgi:hypothetical protein